MLKITVKELGIYFVNCYLIHEENSKSCVAIDPGGNADKVMKFLEENGLTLEAILLTHGHFDHVGAVKDLYEKTQCSVYLHTDDLMLPENLTAGPLFYTHEYGEGDVLELAGLTIRVMHTPGHTKGTISFFYDYDDGERVYRFGSFGGAGANTLVSGAYDFEGCREAYYNSLDRLMKEEVDVFVGNHTWNNATWEKSLELFEGNERVFVDPTLWGRFLGACRDRLNRVIEREKAEN